MAKRKYDQKISVTLRRCEDERGLLNIWRRGANYMSSVPGKRGHRSYHESGQEHTRHTVHNGEERWSDVQHNWPVSHFTGLRLLEAVWLRNEQCWHVEPSPFKRYKGRGADEVIVVRSELVPDGYPIGALVGIVERGRKDILNGYSHDVCRSGYREISSSLLDCNHGPSIFGLALCETEVAHNTRERGLAYRAWEYQKGEPRWPQRDTQTFRPEPSFAVSVQGGFGEESLTKIYSAKGGFGPAPAFMDKLYPKQPSAEPSK